MRRIAACIYGVLPDRNPGFRPTYSATLVLNPTRINDRTVQEQRYLDAALTCAERNHWQLGPKLRNADDQCVGQAYLEMFLLRKDPIMLAGTQARFEQIRAAPRWGTEYGWEQGTNWAWCDALFMAAPTLARLARATGDTAYLTLMNRMWWEPYAFTDDLACTKRISRKHRIRPIRLSTIYVSE